MFSSSEGTVAIEQAISEYQAFEVARVLNASTWHQADHELMGLKQMLDMRRNDLDEPFRDQVAAFNFVGISERMEELEVSSVPNREERLSIMLEVEALFCRQRARCCVDSHPEYRAAQEGDRGCWSNFAATWVA